MSELVDLCGIVVAQQGFWCAKDAADSTNWSIYLTIFTVWLIVSILVLRAIHLGGNGGNSANRILLVVDDLDRCSPAEVIEIAESLKLLLEDSEIQKRVQILMLVDEEILEHATALKFQALIEDREKQSRLRKEYARDDVVREHIEKLFACHLRLPPLNDAEIGELARLYSQVDVQRWRAARAEEIKKQIERLGQAPSPPVQRGAETVFVQERKPSPRFDPKIEISLDKPARIRAESDEAYAGRLERHGQEVAERERVLGELGREQQKLAEATVSARNPVTSGISPQAQLAGSELRFSDEEVSLLEAELAKHMAGKGRRPSPRAIRLFLFKYQLCYLLLHLSRDVAGYDPSGAQPRAILDALGAACFGKGAASASKAHTSRAALDCVVAQVA
jgi:hypothetical protein